MNGSALCHASKGKCPLVGENDSDNHFGNMKDAEAAFAEQQGDNVKTINKNSSKGTQKDYKKIFNEPLVMDNLNELQKAHRNTSDLLDFAIAEKTPQGLVLAPKNLVRLLVTLTLMKSILNIFIRIILFLMPTANQWAWNYHNFQKHQ